MKLSSLLKVLIQKLSIQKYKISYQNVWLEKLAEEYWSTAGMSVPIKLTSLLVMFVVDTESVEVSQWLQPGCSTLVEVPRSPPCWRCWRGRDLSPAQMMDLSTSWNSTTDSTVDWWSKTLAISTSLSNTSSPTSSNSCSSPRTAPPQQHSQVRPSDAPSVERSWPTAHRSSITQLESSPSGARVFSLPASVAKDSSWRIYLCWARTLNISLNPGTESTSWTVNIALTRLETGAFPPVAVEPEEAEESG